MERAQINRKGPEVPGPANYVSWGEKCCDKNYKIIHQHLSCDRG
jgi:hypothetical protein